jgi:protein TonB
MRSAAVSVLASLAVHAAALAGVASLGLWADGLRSDPADAGVRIVPDAGAPVEIELLPPPRPAEDPVRFDSPRPTASLEPDPPTFEPFVEAPAPEAAEERDRFRPMPAPPVFDRPPRPTLTRVVAAAVRRRWEGSVVVGFEVRPDGTCADVGIVQSSGHAVLDEAAVRAVREWRFKPAVRDGIPVAARQTIRFTFRLEK